MSSTPFAAALRAEMEARELTQIALGAILGVSQPTLSNWTTGRYVPEPVYVFEMERALGLRAGSLSRHLGYGPLGSTAMVVSVLDAIAAADLPEATKKTLTAVYGALVPTSTARRSRQAVG